MKVICPACALESLDEEFCDHCNHEIMVQAAAESENIPLCLTFESGLRLDCSEWKQKWPSDPYRYLDAASNGRRFRLHGINPPNWRAVAIDVQRRQDIKLRVLSAIEIAALDGGAFVAAETVPGGCRAAWENRPARSEDSWPILLNLLLEHCSTLVAAAADLHDAGYVWLNFDPYALEVGDARPRITNLDLAIFPKGNCPESLRISPAYSPPEVCNFIGESIGPATDVFHVAMFAYYWLAGLLPHGFPGRGLQAFDFAIPPLRVYCPNIYPGIAPAIERGLARDPAKRPQTVGIFLEGLREAIDVAESRYESNGRQNPLGSLTKWIRWLPKRKSTKTPILSVAGVTRAGRAKSSQRAPNQDNFRIETTNSWFSASRHLVLVTDGVSNARAGNGEIASQMACQLLGDDLTKKDMATPDRFELAVTEACLKASREIVSCAVRGRHEHSSDLRDSDVMSTTAIIALVDDGRLWLANLGDSRVYLISGASVEQLTVDGDVRCSLLASGGAPEDIVAMGNSAKSLRYCLGAAKLGVERPFVSDDQRSVPAFSYWPLRLGDVIVFCTDGLVDEGVFLEPADVQRSIAENIRDTSQALAERLVDKADALQREPSANEPFGFGDNITCVVAKIALEC